MGEMTDDFKESSQVTQYIVFFLHLCTCMSISKPATGISKSVCFPLKETETDR